MVLTFLKYYVYVSAQFPKKVINFQKNENTRHKPLHA